MGNITANDRLIFTLIFSAIIHISIVLGVGFGVTSPPTNSPLTNLEITLVKQQTEDAPEEADFFAQANNEGGGDTETKSAEPSIDTPTPIKKPEATPTEKTAIEPVIETLPTPEISLPQNPADKIPAPEKPTQEVREVDSVKEDKKPQTRPDKALVQAEAERMVHQALEETKQSSKQNTEPNKVKLSARDLKLPSQSDIALLQQQFDSSSQALSKRPKKRQISASTKEYAAAAYMKAWEMKVERIGNFNYPQEAKRQNINGSLMLSVDVNPDGSVPPDGIVVSRSSGHTILDDAAVRIVRLGAPYAAIPENVLMGNDMLTIIRTWKFETSRGLSTR